MTRLTQNLATLKTRAKTFYENGFVDPELEARLQIIRRHNPTELAFEGIALRWYDRAYLVCDRIGVTRWLHKTEEQPECDRTIICNEARGCGRRNCPARIVSVTHYWRCLNDLDAQCYLLAKYCEETLRRLAVGYMALKLRTSVR